MMKCNGYSRATRVAHEAPNDYEVAERDSMPGGRYRWTKTKPDSTKNRSTSSFSHGAGASTLIQARRRRGWSTAV